MAGPCMEESLEKNHSSIAILWRIGVRITLFFQIMLLIFCLTIRDLRTDFLFPCRRWCSHYSFLFSLGASTWAAAQSEALFPTQVICSPSQAAYLEYSYSLWEGIPRKENLCSLIQWLVVFKWVGEVVCGWRVSFVEVQKTDNLWSSCQSTTLDSILDCKGNFRKFAFNS